MIALVMVFCVIGHSDKCTEQRVSLSSPQSSWSCTLNAQREAERYMRDNPTWKLARWRCEPAAEHAHHT